MRFLFLLHGDPAAEAALGPGARHEIVTEHLALAAALRAEGRFVAGGGLGGPEETVVVRPGETPIVTDGPHAATKEAIGGFYLVECADRDEAVAIAARIPRSPGLAVEVLPVVV